MDENYINYLFFNLFYREKQFSLTEVLFQFMPEDMVLGSSMVRLLMNTNVFQVIFPEIVDEFALNRGVDLKCGFSKDYLAGGHLDQTIIS
jgi:hypothetical protein